jgi:hypothetical protein
VLSNASYHALESPRSSEIDAQQFRSVLVCLESSEKTIAGPEKRAEQLHLG